MDEIFLEISTKYTSIPPYCKIYCCDEIVFNGFVHKNIKLNFQKPIDKLFKLQIFKSGKTLELDKNNHEQSIIIKKLILNGIELKIKECSFFEIKNNSYVKDYTIRTNICVFNGCWTFLLPKENLIGNFNNTKIEKLFGKLYNTDIACFGGKEAEANHLSNNERWSTHLSKLTGRDIKNYGIAGGNIKEITAFIKYYNENFKCNNIILLLPYTMRDQIYDKKNEKFVNISNFYKLEKDLIYYGEEHHVANQAGKLKDFCDKINTKTKIIFSSPYRSEYNLFNKTPCKNYMLPFVNRELFPLANDGIHGGAEYNRAFAKSILNNIQ